MQKLTVHEGSQNEWEIAYYLFGNTKSKNLVFMIHGGGDGLPRKRSLFI